MDEFLDLVDCEPTEVRPVPPERNPMPLTIHVHDPNRVVSSVDLLYESERVVVVEIDLHRKRARPGPFCEGTILLEGGAELTLAGRDFADWTSFAETARYTCLWTLLNYGALHRRTIYQDEMDTG